MPDLAPMSLRLQLADPVSGTLETHPLELSDDGTCRLELRALPGSTGLHLEVTNGDGGEGSDGALGVLARFEVDSEPGERVPVLLRRVERDGAGTVFDLETSSGRRVRTLALNRRARPPAPARRPGPTESPAVDLAFLVDGTLRDFTRYPSEEDPAEGSGARELSGLLLNEPELWEPLVESLVQLAERLAETCAGAPEELSVAALAFGDEVSDELRDPLLRARYVLHPDAPETCRFEPLAPKDLCQCLRDLPSTSGGDVVDALADGLAAVQRLRWRPEARKILVLVGDSPGYSIAHPLPEAVAGGDILVRRVDLETEALALHEEGIEIVTLYRPPPEARGFHRVPHAHLLLKHTETQYRRLATLPHLAFVGELVPDDVARALAEGPSVWNRGAGWPALAAGKNGQE